MQLHIGSRISGTFRRKKKSLSLIFSVLSCTRMVLCLLVRPSCSCSTFFEGAVLYVYQYSFYSGGRFFVSAIKQLFAGLYVMELCLIGIFFLARGLQGHPTCTAQAFAMMSILLLTAAYHYFLGHNFRALLHHLPVYGNVTTEVDEGMRSLTVQLHATMSSPTVWILRDPMGLSAEECCAAKILTGSVAISDEGAVLGDDGVVRIEACPP